MHPSLPIYFPFGLLVAWMGCRAARQMWKEKRSRGDMFLMLGLSLLPLAIWILIQFFPQE